MPEFLHLVAPTEALEKMFAALPHSWTAGTQIVSTRDAHGRTLTESVTAPHPLPPFPRSTVDGYAVQAKDTFGASGALPSYLRLIGEILMGKTPTLNVGTGEAVLVHTGGVIPAGADAVVMLEDTQLIDDSEIEVHRAAGVGQNILLEGEDVQEGEVVLEPGTLLRPQEIGGLMALGVTSVPVAVPPRVGILSSGDEVVPPEAKPGPAQVRDVNSHTLAALIERLGGKPILRGIVPDQHEALYEAARQSHGEDDLIVLAVNQGETQSEVAVFVKENELPFTVLLDPQMRVGMAYKARSIPTTYVVDADGVIQYKRIGALIPNELDLAIRPLIAVGKLGD